LADGPTFGRFIAPLKNKSWVVYAKRPFAGPEQVIRYLSAYTHRVAIGNHRIRDIDHNRVHFLYKDYADGAKKKTMTLAAGDNFVGNKIGLALARPKGVRQGKAHNNSSGDSCSTSSRPASCACATMGSSATVTVATRSPAVVNCLAPRHQNPGKTSPPSSYCNDTPA
jgi:hypothetical protein